MKPEQQGARGSGAITIVSGIPRSGTSLMMQMLKTGGMPILSDSKREADEDNPRGYYEFDAIKRLGRDTVVLDQATDKAVKIIYRLLYHLPADRNYRIIMMHREMQEILASQARMLARRGERGAGMGAERLAAVFERELEKLERWILGQCNIAVLHVDYNELVADPEPLVVAVRDFLGWPLDTAAMAAAVDAGLYRQRG